MNKLIQRSLLNALGTVAYVAIVATLMQDGERLFGSVNKTIGTVSFLTMFVLSAAITASLVLGKPLLMYLNNEKKEAVQLFIYTLGWLAVVIALLLVVNIVF